LRQQQQQHSAACERLQRLQWVHCGERPQPAITQQIKALEGGHSRQLVTLRGPSGQPVCERAGPANVAVGHYARVSRRPLVDATAKAEVLAAVRAEQPAVCEEADGSQSVEVGEITAAMVSSRPGTAPGPDGLPLILFKRFKDMLLPLLARVFGAIGSTSQVPPHFLDGAIVAILKPGGDPLETVGYRPITLLNTDYRLLARVLADRLQPALQAVVSPSQTAFLKGRRSGANILLLQLLAEGLPINSELVAALLDFAKAYDTIDRGFLLEVMREMGVGDAFCAWVQTLLTATHARAVINGFVSDPKVFEAGVRQGCPLSPLLYLCVAEALLRYLKQQGVGVTVLGVKLVSTQFADDTQVYLPSDADLPAFFVVMESFAAATGQHLNISKTKVLVLGRAARQARAAQQQQQRQHQQQQQQHGQPQQQQQRRRRREEPQVVTTATVLGVSIGGEPASVYAERTPGVLAALKRLSQLKHLSALGRGLSSAAYGVSKMLYAAEFSDLPTDAECHALSAAVARLVDRGISPDSQERLFAGVGAELLKGKPAHGGFGVLPWREHILARHAAWGAKFVSAPAGTAEPWVQLGRAILRQMDLSCGPMACLEFPRLPLAPSAVRRMLAGLQALGRVCALRVPSGPGFVASPVSGPVLAPGPWCANAPLWGNLFAPAPAAPAVGPRGMQVLPRARAPRVPNAGGLVRTALVSVGDAIHALRIVRPLALRNPYVGPWADGDSEVVDLASVLSALPPGWRQAATTSLAAVPPPLEAFLRSPGLSSVPFTRALSVEEVAVDCGLVSGLGWQLGATPVFVSGLTVRQATALQMRPVFELRTQYRRDFVDEVLPTSVRGNPALVAACCKALATAQRHLWKLRWDNAFKEIYWRLVVNGLATAERMHMHDCGCVCGSVVGGQPGRHHHFWACPVARAVVDVLQQQLVGWFPGELQPQHVLCMVCPVAVGVAGAPALHKGVWRVVCLVAINAMDLGRTAANLQRLEELPVAAPVAPVVPQGQRLLTDLLSPAALTVAQQQHRQQVQQRQQERELLQQQQAQQVAAARLQMAKQQAVGRFWELLQDFVVLNVAPRAWLPALAPNHPFLRVSGDLLGVHCVAVAPGAG
jgi:hypothetical protein